MYLISPAGVPQAVDMRCQVVVMLGQLRRVVTRSVHFIEALLAISRLRWQLL